MYEGREELGLWSEFLRQAPYNYVRTSDKYTPRLYSCLLDLRWDKGMWVKPLLRSYFTAESPDFTFPKNRIVPLMKILGKW